MSFAVYPQPDACRAWMPMTPMPPGASPPSPPMVCHMPKGHDGQHSNERRPGTLSRRWDGDARPVRESQPTLVVSENRQRAAELLGFGRLEQAETYALGDLERIAAALDAAEARGRTKAIERAACAVEALRPHIPPSTDPDRRTRIVQRSSFNRAASAVRASAGELS